MCTALHRAFTQAPYTVSVGVKSLNRIARAAGMEQPPLFYREKKNQSVDQSQKLVKVILHRQNSALQVATQGLVLGMREETLPECDKGFFYSSTQVFSSTRALFPACVAPRLKRTLENRLVLTAKARIVAKQPQCGKVSVTLLGKNALKVGFNPCGTSKARIVTHDAQRRAVTGDPPESTLLCVEILLCKAERTALATSVAKYRRESIESTVDWRDYDGHTASKRLMPYRVRALRENDWLCHCERGEAKRIAEKGEDEALRDGHRISFRLTARIEVGPMRLRDAPVAPNFIAEVKSLGHTIVCFCL